MPCFTAGGDPPFTQWMSATPSGMRPRRSAGRRRRAESAAVAIGRLHVDVPAHRDPRRRARPPRAPRHDLQRVHRGRAPRVAPLAPRGRRSPSARHHPWRAARRRRPPRRRRLPSSPFRSGRRTSRDRRRASRCPRGCSSTPAPGSTRGPRPRARWQDRRGRFVPTSPGSRPSSTARGCRSARATGSWPRRRRARERPRRRPDRGAGPRRRLCGPLRSPGPRRAPVDLPAHRRGAEDRRGGRSRRSAPKTADSMAPRPPGRSRGLGGDAALTGPVLRCGTTWVRYSSSQRVEQKRCSSPSTSAIHSRLATTWPQQSHGVTTVSHTCVTIGSQRPIALTPRPSRRAPGPPRWRRCPPRDRGRPRPCRAPADRRSRLRPARRASPRRPRAGRCS